MVTNNSQLPPLSHLLQTTFDQPNGSLQLPDLRLPYLDVSWKHPTKDVERWVIPGLANDEEDFIFLCEALKVPTPSPSLQNGKNVKFVQKSKIKKLKRAARKTDDQRQCMQCGATETTQFRKSPDGSLTLCNACGLKLSKAANKAKKQQKDAMQTQDPVEALQQGYKGRLRIRVSTMLDDGSTDEISDEYQNNNEKKRTVKVPSIYSKGEQIEERVVAIWKCAQCNTETTPEKREGPLGKGTLCNACGIRWSKRGKPTPPPKPKNEIPSDLQFVYVDFLKKD